MRLVLAVPKRSRGLCGRFVFEAFTPTSIQRPWHGAHSIFLLHYSLSLKERPRQDRIRSFTPGLEGPIQNKFNLIIVRFSYISGLMRSQVLYKRFVCTYDAYAVLIRKRKLGTQACVLATHITVIYGHMEALRLYILVVDA